MADRGAGDAAAARAGSGQLPLDLTLEPQWGEEDFLVGPSNAEAFALIERWPDWPGRVLVLRGPAGAGKTHLSRIWCARSGAIWRSAAGLAVADAPALAEQGAAIDGILPGIDETALFHLVNLAAERGRDLLLTAGDSLLDWRPALPDLASRLRRAPEATIGQADDALIRALLVKLFLDRQLRVDPALIDYAAMRLERSFEATRRFVAVLDRMSLAMNRRLTVRLAGEALERMAGQP
jgi:chromosomal replication initiation ATPase DnaA